MLNATWRYVTCGLLVVLLLGGRPAYAADTERIFFWSDAVPTPSCYESRDDGTKEVGLSIDGKKVAEPLLRCEEAMKNRVLVLVNGNYLHAVAGTGAEPFIENGRTLIPLRALADAFGFEVGWEPNEQKITLNKDSLSIMMHIGKPEMLVNGITETLEDTVPMIKNNLTFLPVRQLAEILGVQVDWDSESRTAAFSQ